MPESESVTVARDGDIAIVTLNRPAVLNAVDAGLRDGLIAAMTAANRDTAVRGVVITGAGERAFCAGQDLDVSQSLTPETVADWFCGLRAFYQSVRDMDKPVVAALNGAATGAGFQLSLWCDMRVAHPEVRVAQPEIDAGIPSIIGSMVIRAVLGQSRTVELALSCRLVPAEEAKRMGAITEVVPREQVLPRALAIARTLAAQPPHALRLTKNRVRDLTQPDFDSAIEAAIAAARLVYAAGEPQAAAAAFRARSKAGAAR